MIAAELIRRGAVYYPDKIAVIYEGDSRTFKEVNQNSNRLANALHKLGLKKGVRVAFLLANSVQSVEIDFAMIKSGLIRVPLNTRLSEQELIHMINETDAKAILFTEEFAEKVATLRPQTPDLEWYCQVNGESTYDWTIPVSKEMELVSDEEPEVELKEDDPVTLQYTSGTTGKLKAAIHTTFMGSYRSKYFVYTHNKRGRHDDACRTTHSRIRNTHPPSLGERSFKCHFARF